MIRKEQIKQGIKEELESLAGKIPGLLDIGVYTEGLATSTADVMLDSSFEDEQPQRVLDEPNSF